MRICKHCRRDLDLRSHAPLCAAGNVVKQIDRGEPVESVRIAFPNDELKQAYSDMMARTAMMMQATKVFFDVCTELDDNAPDLTDQVAPHLEKFVVDLMLIYPNPEMFDVDLKTLLGQKVE
jgi:hypothetical protein